MESTEFRYCRMAVDSTSKSFGQRETGERDGVDAGALSRDFTREPIGAGQPAAGRRIII